MKKILYIMFLAIIIIFSVSAIQASDNNITDSDTIESSDIDNISLQSELADDNLESDVADILIAEDTSIKNKTELTSPTSTIYYKGDYTLTLKDSNASAGVANRTVNFIINNVKYTATTDSNGVAGVNLALNPGKYNVIAYFAGDDAYEASNNLTSTVNILSTVKAYDMTKYYNGPLQYSATFYDSYGKVLTNRNVAISVNGKTYYRNTNNNGVASLNINLKPGTYTVVSTDPITGYKLTTKFTILNTISAGNVQKFIGDSKKFTAKFYKSNGKPLAKKYIKFKLKGKTYKVKTNSKGIAKLSLNKLKKGTYNVVCYNKDGLSKSFKIQVYKNKATTRLSANFYTFNQDDDKQVSVKFTTSIGGQSVSGKTIKIRINGKTYSQKTDSNGIATLKLPNLNKGLYTVSYNYEGTKYIKASKTTNYVTVLKQTDTDFSVKSTTSFGYGAGTPLKIAVTAGGVPLAKKTVTFNINGNKFVKTTDYNGIASLPINLKIGDYTVNYMTSGDSKVNGSSGSCDINVFKRTDVRLTWSSATSFKDNSQTFKVLVSDVNGKALAGVKVNLKIDGESYSATSNSHGYAIFKTSVAIGNYKVSVNSEDTNYYIQSSTSKSVNVKLSLFKNGVNEKTSTSRLSGYLKSSSHCKVGTKQLKKLVKSLTKGLTSKVDKAKALFNYVRDTLSYSYYYNSKYGSSKTLKLKRGNCVDHSHLLVALYRTAGFQARYVHGKCTFSDERTGHVWTQVKIGNTWVCGDAISYRNSLGKINNWNTKTVKINGKYSSLPF